MKKPSKSKRPLSAESIARLADEGRDISSLFSNKGKMMQPLRAEGVYSTDFESVAPTLDNFQKSTRELMQRVHRKDLIYEFVFVFSRFEHALSVTSYLSETKGGVSADWDKFAREMNEVFLGTLSPEVIKAVKYYEKAPPRKQVVDFDSLTWKDVVPQTNYKLEKLLLLIRRVRNNLFHGEKFAVLLEGDSKRDTELLRHGLTILYACLHVSTDLRRKFFSEIEVEAEEDEEEVVVS